VPRRPLGWGRYEFFSAILLLCVLIPASALADSVVIDYGPNSGGGDNFGFAIRAPGLYISGFGGTPFDFFNCGCFGPEYRPGSTLGGFTDIFFSDGFAQIGGISSEVSFDVGSLFMSSIVLPTNGKDFNAPVEIAFSASGTLVDTGDSITASGGANGHIKFDFSDGLYYPEYFIAAPEPGTLGLIGTGLIGILARVRKRRSVGQISRF